MVLVPGLGRSRAAAILPLHHIAVIPFSSVYPTLEAWMRVRRENGRLCAWMTDSSQVAVVTGPSKSADIELNLTLGVHGPKLVHALMVDDR
jgi:L-lactate dehydrogenase complex protein LldG